MISQVFAGSHCISQKFPEKKLWRNVQKHSNFANIGFACGKYQDEKNRYRYTGIWNTVMYVWKLAVDPRWGAASRGPMLPSPLNMPEDYVPAFDESGTSFRLPVLESAESLSSKTTFGIILWSITQNDWLIHLLLNFFMIFPATFHIRNNARNL